MPRYLTDADYKATIKDDTLYQLTGGVEAVKIKAENQAVGAFRQYVGARYDVDWILGQVEDNGTDIRDPFIVKVLLDITVYMLYRPLAPHQIPEHRKDDYADAIAYLKDVGTGKIDAFFKKSNEDIENNYSEVRINSHPKSNHRY